MHDRCVHLYGLAVDAHTRAGAGVEARVIFQDLDTRNDGAESIATGLQNRQRRVHGGTRSVGPVGGRAVPRVCNRRRLLVSTY